MRRLMVFDGTAWFIRSVRTTVQDRVRDEMVYHCDKPLAGPLSFEDAVAFLRRGAQ